MTDTAAEVVPGDQIAAALKEAHAVARSKGRGRSQELRDALTDAATDAVLWCSSRFFPSRGESFPAFCGSVVRQFVTRAAQQWVRDTARKPMVVSLSEPDDDSDVANPEFATLAAKPVHGPGEADIPLSIRELPDEIQAAVRFFYIDRFTLRETALLMNCGREKVRELLKQAAQLLDPGREVPNRRPNARRIMR